MPLPEPEAAILAAGPWTHRDIAANGSRFHIADLGDGPMVLLLHGFPTFWWTWRRQLAALADAGYHAVAMDLRGYGASDHPPEGYDPRTLSRDVAGVIRSLGREDAVIVGHGWGGLAAWSTAVLEPETVRAIASVSMPHPRQLRKAMLRDRRQRAATRYALGFQVPFWPERSLTSRDGQRIADLLRDWSADASWLDPQTCETYRAAFLRWPTAHTAVEYHRWAVRSSIRPDGLSYMSLMEAPIQCSVLTIQGTDDPMMLAGSLAGSEDYVRADYQRIDLPTGHFPHEEAPDEFNTALLAWLAGLAGPRAIERPRDALGRPLPVGSVDQQPTIPRPVSDADAWKRGIEFISSGQPFAAHELFELRWRDVHDTDRQSWQALAKWGAALTHAARGNATGAVSVARGALDLLDTAPTIPDCVDLAYVRASLNALVTP